MLEPVYYFITKTFDLPKGTENLAYNPSIFILQAFLIPFLIKNFHMIKFWLTPDQHQRDKMWFYMTFPYFFY